MAGLPSVVLAEDARADIQHHFGGDGWGFSLDCSTHGRPLRWPPARMELGALQMNRMPAWLTTPKARSVLRTITRFALITQDSSHNARIG